MENKISADRSSNIEWMLHKNGSLFIKYKNVNIAYEYANYSLEKFMLVKNEFEKNESFSLGSWVHHNIKIPYGSNFKKHHLNIS